MLFSGINLHQRRYKTISQLLLSRDWSLITGRGATKREVGGGGGALKFYPYQKWGGGGVWRKKFSHVEGGAQQFLG